MQSCTWFVVHKASLIYHFTLPCQSSFWLTSRYPKGVTSHLVLIWGLSIQLSPVLYAFSYLQRQDVILCFSCCGLVALLVALTVRNSSQCQFYLFILSAFSLSLSQISEKFVLIGCQLTINQGLCFWPFLLSAWRGRHAHNPFSAFQKQLGMSLLLMFYYVP